jgi:hypothetical protein
MAAFKITDLKKVPSAEVGRVGKYDYLVIYSLDPFRTYMVVIPKDTITEQDIKEAVRKDLESINQFINKEIQL